ncbi:MAG: hypothetical protein JWN56_2150 [Sphingobacteriales bacterium]|nr:hypothetical protein [Sphingobacteriales bacterium]
MIMKTTIAIVILAFSTLTVCSQTLKNTSYTNQSGEKVLRLEMLLPVEVTTAWKLFTSDDQLMKWAAR